MKWNYLRVRGEYFAKPGAWRCCVELPPRARRIPCDGFHIDSVCGTTSACAENTSNVMVLDSDGVNYLRVRGEYAAGTSAAGPETELPPRARRIPEVFSHPFGPFGTTSACAENTPTNNAVLIL